MIGKWYETSIAGPGRFFYPLENLGSDHGFSAEKYRGINMPLALKQYVISNYAVRNLPEVKDVQKTSALNRACIIRTFRRSKP